MYTKRLTSNYTICIFLYIHYAFYEKGEINMSYSVHIGDFPDTSEIIGNFILDGKDSLQKLSNEETVRLYVSLITEINTTEDRIFESIELTPTIIKSFLITPQSKDSARFMHWDLITSIKSNQEWRLEELFELMNERIDNEHPSNEYPVCNEHRILDERERAQDMNEILGKVA